MTNAKEELLGFLGKVNFKKEEIRCAQIRLSDPGRSVWNATRDDFTQEGARSINVELKEGYTEEELDKFFNELDFEYYSNFGCQILYGIVWLNNAWLSREEYDGSEWWKYNHYPIIPRELKKDA